MNGLNTTSSAMTTVVPTSEQQQYLTFSLGGEMFAMGILSIKEIIEFGQLTEVPLMPAFIRGVINLRGSVLPVIDLSARFGRMPTAITRRTCIVIIEVHHEGLPQDIGVMVDAVSEVLDILPEHIEPAPAFGAKIRTDFIEGMGKVNEKFVIILKVDQVLSMEEMSFIAASTQMAPPSVPTMPLEERVG